jgi:hypothetical protein
MCQLQWRDDDVIRRKVEMLAEEVRDCGQRILCVDDEFGLAGTARGVDQHCGLV